MKEVKNLYGCPEEIWVDLTGKQRIVYNRMRGTPAGTICSARVEIEPLEWEIISHNISHLAAVFARDAFKKQHDTQYVPGAIYDFSEPYMV